MTKRDCAGLYREVGALIGPARISIMNLFPT
jgi:hypothetical protein